MNNIHTQIETWMVAALTDTLTATERNAFDAHLAACARCRQLFADQQNISSLLEQAFAPDQPDDEFEERMVEKFRQNVAKKKFFGFFNRRDVISRNVGGAFLPRSGEIATGMSLLRGVVAGARRVSHFPVVRFAAAAAIVALLVVLGGALSGEVNLSFEGSKSKPVTTLANLRSLIYATNEGKFPVHTVGIGDTEPPATPIRLNPNEKTGVSRLTFKPNWDGESVLRAGIPAEESEFITGNTWIQRLSGEVETYQAAKSGGTFVPIYMRFANTEDPRSGADGKFRFDVVVDGGTVSTAFPAFANRITEANSARWAMNSGTMEFANANVEVVHSTAAASAPNLFKVAGRGGLILDNVAINNGLIMGENVGLGGSLTNQVNGLFVGGALTNAAGGYVDMRPDVNKPDNFDYASNDKSRVNLTSGYIAVGSGSVTLLNDFLSGGAAVAPLTQTGGFTITGRMVNEGGVQQGGGEGRETSGRFVNEGKTMGPETPMVFRTPEGIESGASLTTAFYQATKTEPHFDLWSGGKRRDELFDDLDKTSPDDGKKQLADAEKRAQQVRAQTEGHLTGRDIFARFGPSKEVDERTAAFEIAPVVPEKTSELGFDWKGRGTLGAIDTENLVLNSSSTAANFDFGSNLKIYHDHIARDGRVNFVGTFDSDRRFVNFGSIVAGNGGTLSVSNIGTLGYVHTGTPWKTLRPVGSISFGGFSVTPERAEFMGFNPYGGSISVPDNFINQGGGTQEPVIPPNRLAQQPPVKPQPKQQPPPKIAAPTPQPPPVGVTEVRKLIRSAQMEFEVNSYDQTMVQVQAIVGEERGLLVTSNSSRLPNGKVRGDVVIKVLPDHLERLVWKLRGIGELKKQTLGSQDVTKQYFDTEARKRNLEAMEKRLLEMLAKTQGKVAELLEVEKEIARVRAEIEGLQGELKYVDTLVAYATINLTLYEKDLNQPAAFQLKEKANLSIFSPDVEKTLNDAKKSAETAKAQVLHSKLERESSGRVTATFSVLAAPDVADLLLESFRNLGRVASLNRTSERVAIGGSGASDTAKVEKDKVEINLVVVHDDESRRRVRLTVVTKAVEDSLEKAKAAAAKHGAEVIVSNFTRPSAGESAAQFTVRVPSKAYDAVLGEFKAFGRVAEFNVELKENNADGKENAAPVLVALVLASSEPPLQITHLAVQRQGVEAVLDKLKQDAVKLGGEIRASNFVRTPDGQELANLALRIPLKDNAALVEMLKAYGDVKSLSVERQDRVQEGKPDENAPAEVRLQFFSHQAPMQITQLAVERKDVESVLAHLKEQATKLGAEIRASNFVRYPNGQELANLAFRISLKQNQPLLDLLRSLGDVKGYTVERQDRVTDGRFDENAPAEIRLQLSSAPPIIEQDSGFMVTMKQTIGQGFGWFMWGIKMIGVALAFIAPWLAALLVLWWGWKRIRRKKTAKA